MEQGSLTCSDDVLKVFLKENEQAFTKETYDGYETD